MVNPCRPSNIATSWNAPISLSLRSAGQVPIGHLNSLVVTLTKPAVSILDLRNSPDMRSERPILEMLSSWFAAHFFMYESSGMELSSQSTLTSSSWHSIQPPGLQCLWTLRINVELARTGVGGSIERSWRLINWLNLKPWSKNPCQFRRLPFMMRVWMRSKWFSGNVHTASASSTSNLSCLSLVCGICELHAPWHWEASWIR